MSESESDALPLGDTPLIEINFRHKQIIIKEIYAIIMYIFSFKLYWLGWQDLNLRMPESKSGALPLGDTPILYRT